MKTILKTARENKGLMIREVAHQLGIDQALVSKFESGTRNPTKAQLAKLAQVLDIPYQQLMVSWLKEKILKEVYEEDFALEALIAAEDAIKYQLTKKTPKNTLPKELKGIVKEINTLKKQLDKYRKFDSYRIAQALELEYTFESNRIEGNTLTLKETDLVINEGLTISGKTMREHLEAINHKDAIEYVKHLVDTKSEFNERELLTIHNLVLRGIDAANAGKYRTVQVMIKGSAHTPPAPFLVAKQMEDYFIWYNQNKEVLHPVLLAAELHEKLVTIHPFIDGNGRTARLIMNLILLKHGFVIANIKGDAQSRMNYYNALEMVQTQQSKTNFLTLIANYEMQAIERYISIISK